mmetsp:Transcript_11753/g.17529  ORF Transcript_11753/g.17529 Transcript_11753/m.17529 type:complete len:299 (+) Transcript_11753:80-976(+)
MADSNELVSAFQNIRDGGLAFSAQISALNKISFPSEVCHIVDEIWEKAYIIRNYHLLVLQSVVTDLRMFMVYFNFDSKDFGSFVECIEYAKADVNAVKVFREKFMSMHSKLYKEIADLKCKAEMKANEASDRARIAALDSSVESCFPIAPGVGALATTAGSDTASGFCIHQSNNKSEKIAEIVNEEIKKGNAWAVVNSLIDNVSSCIQTLNTVVQTFYYEVKKCDTSLDLIESIITSGDIISGKSIYVRAKGDAKILSKACMDFNTIVPLCMNLPEFSDSNVSNWKKSNLALTWEEYL